MHVFRIVVLEQTDQFSAYRIQGICFVHKWVFNFVYLTEFSYFKMYVKDLDIQIFFSVSQINCNEVTIVRYILLNIICFILT
jgi:hypothetical protein